MSYEKIARIYILKKAFLPHPVIDFREQGRGWRKGGGERERERERRERHQSVALHTLYNHRSNPQPFCVRVNAPTN